MSKANLANAILAAPVADTDTSATLVTGYGATMPPVPFKLTFTPFGQLSTMGNSEIVLVTNITGEVLTIERAKGGTTAKDFETGDIVSNGIYIENSVAVGDIFMSMRETAAAGRLFMAGGTFSKSDYPLLYKFVGDNPAYGTQGGSPGSETFTLADMRERMPFGKSSNSPFTTLGGVGGSQVHTHTLNNAAAQIGARQGQANTIGYRNRDIGDLTGSIYNIQATNMSGSQRSHNTALTGSTDSTNHMSPYILVNYEVVCG